MHVSDPVKEHVDSSFQEEEKEIEYQTRVGILNSEEHVYTETVPKPIAEMNPAWRQLLESISDKTNIKKSKKEKDDIPPLPLRRSVRFKDKGATSS